jgi:hypothetical protein
MMFPKFEYVRSKPLLKAVSSLPCQCCGIDGQTQAAHSNQSRHGKGRGIKASDIYIAALCQSCHYRIDQGNDLAKSERQELWDAAHIKTVTTLVRSGEWPLDVPIPDTRIFDA